jgi:hypothetical protein
VELLWSSKKRLDIDYTMSLVLLDETGQIVAQLDSQPFFNQRPTTSWQIGELVYDLKQLDLAQAVSEKYRLDLVVYHQEEGQIIRENTQEGQNHISLNMNP